jgi:uncharacterized protein (TIGR02001 family)
MTQLKTILLILALAAVATPTFAMGPLDVSADLAFNSKYVWRGMVATDDPVLQPGVSASVAGFGFGFWGNIDTSDINGNEFEFNEIDYIISYGMSLPLVSFGAGLIYYDFPNTGMDATTELYLTASAGVLLSPTLTVYQDIDRFKGAYWEASVSHGMPLSPAANLELTGALGLGSKGYFNGYFGVMPDPDVPGGVSEFTGASMSDFRLTAGVPYSTIPFFTITPAVTYTTLLGDAKDAVELADGDKDTFYYGLTVSFRF